MSLPDDLLIQARMLATIDRRRPKQVNLRRAISNAYYALFHLLTTDAARLFVRDDPAAASRIARTLSHADVRNVSLEFSRGQLPKSMRSIEEPFEISPQLRSVSDAVTRLQQARHRADCDLDKTFTRPTAIGFIEEAETAFAHWASVKSADDARLYLACFSNWDSWNKPPR